MGQGEEKGKEDYREVSGNNHTRRIDKTQTRTIDRQFKQYLSQRVWSNELYPSVMSTFECWIKAG